MYKLKERKELIRVILGIVTLLLMLLTFIFLANHKVIAEELEGTYDGVDWKITTEGELILGKEGETQTFTNRSVRNQNSYPWNTYRKQLTSVKFAGKVIGQGNMSYMFYDCSNLTSLDLSNFNTSNITDMGDMFSGCTGLTSLYLSNFDTSSVTDMSYMFSNCKALTSLGLSSFDTSNVTSMMSMFFNCSSLTNLDLSNFNTSKVTSMYSMFSNCSSLTNLDVSSFDTSNVTSMYSMFSLCRRLNGLDISNFNTSNVTNMSYMFNNCYGFSNLDLRNFDTSNVTDMSGMFYNCINIVTLDVSSFDTSKVTNMHNMFSLCSRLNSLDISNFNTSNVTNMSYMFSDCRALASLNLSNFNTSKVSDMGSMFSNCSKIVTLDLSNFNTSKVTSMYSMFSNCRSLTNLDLSSFDTSKVTSMYSMFESCRELTSIDLTNFDTSKVTSMYSMFKDTTNLEEIKIGTKTDLSKSEHTGYYWSKTKSQIDSVKGINKINSPGTWYKTDTICETGLPYEAKGLGENNIWELNDPDKKFRGFCINLNRIAPKGYYCKREANDASLVNGKLLSSDNYGYTPIGNNMKEALITLIYNKVSNQTIWDYTNRFSKQSDETKTWAETHHFSDIPNGDKYKLYIYESVDGERQNLLSIEGALENPKGGVVVSKKGTDGQLLDGAEFTIYKGEKALYTVTSKNGYAGIYRMDNSYGLDIGTYTVRETKAPAGYKLGDEYFTFEVTKDQELVREGKKKGTGDKVEMVFTDDKDETYQGGGIEVKNTGLNDEPLSGSEFTIYKDNSPVKTITTYTTGVASTGIRDLPFGDYTVRETKAPDGYKLPDEVKTFKIDQDSTYVSGDFTFKNASKTGSIVLKATKKMAKLAKGTYSFQLLDQDNKVLQTKTNNENGEITFDTINYNASNLGYINYKIREVIGSDETINYDTHTEEITVFIEDDGTDNLKVYSETDEDGLVFENTSKRNPKGQIELSGTKVLNGKKIQKNQFEFELKEGNTVIDTKENDEEGKITFKKIEYNYDDLGTHTYEISEKGIAPQGYTYDTHTETVTVLVEDQGTDELKVTPTYDSDKIKFTNTYKASGNVDFSASKVLSGRGLADNQFTFQLKDSKGEILQTKKNNQEGKIIFDKINYNESDIGKTYVYTISEVDDKQPGYTYDSHEETISVKVEDNGDGTLKANISGEHQSSFTNLYNSKGKAIIELNKKYINASIEGGEFSYTLYNENDKELQTVTNDSTGKITFSPIEYNESDINKEHKYKIKENKEKTDVIDYDDSVKEVTVKLTDNGDGTLKETITFKGNDNTFTNTRKGKVKISKQDIAGNELEGAKLVIKDSKDKVVDTWTSTKEPHEVVLYKGEYTLIEDEAPLGYEKSESILFEIGENGKTIVGEEEKEEVVMTDEYTNYKISLYKEDKDGKQLNGAKIEIINENMDKIDEWVSDGKEHEIKVPFGKYIIREVQAPMGYKNISDDIIINIEKNGEVIANNTNNKIKDNEIHIINEKDNDDVIKVEVPPTSKNINNILRLTAFFLIALATGLYYYHKRV